ncbi:MAG: glucose-1-phosphate cytidylyltransferase [Blastocatellia bacterium]|nr:glucose-1-phosphate cytidylyltransferase [Blastocatellia bacterium]
MKVVILAGGLGTRLAEETEIRPKPMIEIGGRPILWHIMKLYSHYGFNEFFIALGYKGEVIKRFFLDYYNLTGSMKIDLQTGTTHIYNRETENWVVHLMDTGLESSTGGRVKRLAPWLQDGPFMVTYGDGVCDVNVQELLTFHRSHGRLGTVTAVRPPARFGGLVFEGDLVSEFTEKPQIGEGWINGGFMVLEPGLLDYLPDDSSSLEVDGLEHLARNRQLAAFRHEGFWQCMDTLRDKRLLEHLWEKETAPWKLWK